MQNKNLLSSQKPKFLHSDISSGELKQVVLTLDPAKPPEELIYLLSRGFAVPPQQISEGASEVTTTVAKLLHRLKAGHVLRTGSQ